MDELSDVLAEGSERSAEEIAREAEEMLREMDAPSEAESEPLEGW
jgi:hypothetical protein